MPSRFTRTGGSASRTWLAVLFLLGLLLLAPALASAQAADTCVVSWSAPGDDGTRGTASQYDLRMSGSPITAQNFSQATPVDGVPAPRSSGTRQNITVRELTPGNDYYFAIRSADNMGNWSGISNIAHWNGTVDAAPPLPPRGVQALRQSDGVHVTWDANTEADLAGYNLYRSIDGGASARVNANLLTGTTFLDSTVPAGATALAYAITAVDAHGNESAVAQAPQIGVAAATEWKLIPGYPNPSRAAESVRIPLQVPSGATGDVIVQILDSGGRIVRRFVVSNPSPGTTEVVWDGTNDSGRATAPGVYRGWLITGSTRSGVRLLRVP